MNRDSVKPQHVHYIHVYIEALACGGIVPSVWEGFSVQDADLNVKNYVSECSSLVVILWLEYAIHQLLRQYIDIYMYIHGV